MIPHTGSPRYKRIAKLYCSVEDCVDQTCCHTITAWWKHDIWGLRGKSTIIVLREQRSTSYVEKNLILLIYMLYITANSLDLKYLLNLRKNLSLRATRSEASTILSQRCNFESMSDPSERNSEASVILRQTWPSIKCTQILLNLF